MQDENAVEQSEIDTPETEPQSFADMADRLADNIATAALRLTDAAQDLAAIIAGLIGAGKELEAALSFQRKLNDASLQSVQDARDAAGDAIAAKDEALRAKEGAEELLATTRGEHASISALSSSLRKGIAALHVLADDRGAEAPAIEVDPPSDINSEAA